MAVDTTSQQSKGSRGLDVNEKEFLWGSPESGRMSRRSHPDVIKRTTQSNP